MLYIETNSFDPYYNLAAEEYLVKNKKEEYVELLDFGATIHSINVLDKKGNIGDVVLGINKASDLEKNSFAGITIGRCANRIEYGKCVIDGKERELRIDLSPDAEKPFKRDGDMAMLVWLENGENSLLPRMKPKDESNKK